MRAVIKPPGNGGSVSTSILETASPKDFCDNAWHRIRVEIIGLKFSLRVDEESTKIGSLSKEILSFLLNVPVYFGGLERKSTFSAFCAKMRYAFFPLESVQNLDTLQLPSKSFRGCLRDVSINGESVDWRGAALRKRTVLNGCPFTEVL